MTNFGSFLISAIITLVAYGAGPLVFCETQTIAGLRKIRIFCAIYTTVVFIIFSVIQFFTGGTPNPVAAIFWGVIFYKIVKKKLFVPEVKPIAEVDVDRHKDSETLGRDLLTPYCTNRRYQYNDWATIESYLKSTLRGKNGEELLFKYRATTPINRAGNYELIYSFDSLTENGEKYSELYVWDECNKETTVPPVGYRFAKEFTTQEKTEAKSLNFSLSAPDEKPTTPSVHNTYGSDVALIKPDETSNASLSSSADEPIVPEKENESSQHQVDCAHVEHTPEIRFCRKCGSQLVPNGRFCSQCGTEIAKE